MIENRFHRPAGYQGGKGGDNGGGSCDALSLGAVALLVPGLLLGRGKKQVKG